MKFYRKNCFGMLTVLATLAGQAAAVPVSTLSSKDFAYKYEMAVGPNTQDLDSNGAGDWWPGGSLPSLSGGIANGSSGDLYRTDFNGPALSIWRAQFPDDDPYTVEIRAKILTTGNEGSSGTMAGSFVREGDDSTGILYISRAGQAYNTGAGGATSLGTNDNTDDFHVFRVVRDNDGVWIWRDSQLLNPGSALSETTIGGATGLFVGDTGGATSGDWQLDYIRITPGAFAPTVPEPSSALLLLTGTIVFARRRRNG